MKYLVRGPMAKGRVGPGSRSFSALPLGQGPQDVLPKCPVPHSWPCSGNARGKKTATQRAFPTRSQALQFVSASLARDLPSCGPAQSPHTREGAGKTLRWQSTAHFSFKRYFSYLVVIPAPTLGSKAPSSFPALQPLISPSPKRPVHLSANSCLSLVPTRS